MDERALHKIRKEVCAAGLRLVREGLVARSWGNISVRIDERTMAITPSGIRYEDVGPEHIVVVNLADGSHAGDVKPSGERKLHIAIYRARPEVGAVMHTHQLNASICAAARIPVPVMSAADSKLLGADTVFCAGYGLPGTGKLMKETTAAIRGGMCALMANHGAVCLGRDLAGAFKVATALERVCGEFIAGGFARATGLAKTGPSDIRAHYELTHGGR